MKLGSTGSIAKNNFIESKLTVAFFLIVFSVTIQIFKFQIRVRILKKKKIQPILWVIVPVKT